MFAYPLLPTMPPSLRPSTYIAGVKSLLSLPTSIDYSAISPTSKDLMTNGKRSMAAHTGPLADLPPDTCPICHLRSTTAPVDLGAGVSLPAVDPHVTGDKEENRIFVPAQTDCWGGCRWCYYCIMGELATCSQDQHQQGGEGKTGAEVKWDCLRCGGGVTKAWRAGPDVDVEPGISPPDELVPESGPEQASST